MTQLELLYQSLQKRVQKLQSELIYNSETLQSVIAHLTSGLIFINSKAVIEFFNPALEKLTHHTHEKCIQSPFHQFFDDQFFGFSVQEALSSNEEKCYQALVTFETENHLVDAEISAKKIQKKGLLILATDCSTKRQLEKAVQQNEYLASIGEMAAVLAHEIRNPLGGITGFASLLKEELENPEHQKKLSYIIEGTKALNELVTNVLEYCRPLSLKFSLFNLIDVIERARFLFDGKCEIVTQCDSFWMHGDQERLCGAFLNLLRNSQEAGSPSALVKVFENGEIRIIDQGCGINAEMQKKVFSPFFTTKAKGTGLGLSEVKKVIIAHGGEIQIESSEVQRGTIFLIKLPKVER